MSRLTDFMSTALRPSPRAEQKDVRANVRRRYAAIGEDAPEGADSVYVPTSLPPLTEGTALQVPVVGLILNAIERSFQSMEIRTPTANARSVMSITPNSGWTAPAFWGWVGRNAFLQKRALVEITRRPGNNTMHELWPGKGTVVAANRASTLPNAYRFMRIGEATQREVPVADMLEFASTLPPAALMDTPAATSIALLKLLDDAVVGVFDSGMLQRILLIAKKALNDKGLRATAKAFQESYARGLEGAHVPITVDNDVQVESLAPDLRQAQMEEISKLVERRVLSHFNLPTDLVEEGLTVDSLRVVYRMLVMPLTHLFQAEVKRKLGLDIEFNPTSLLRGDPDERQKYYVAALGAPGKRAWLTANEVRDREGEPRVDEEHADQLNDGNQQGAEGVEPSDDDE